MRGAGLTAIVCMAGIIACDGNVEELSPATISVADSAVCDAGNESFVTRLIPFIWGRKPASIREVELLSQVIEQSSRAELVRAMTRTAAYRSRWELFLKDILRVNRMGLRGNPGCYADMLIEIEDAELATYIRDHAPEDGAFPAETAWTMLDLIRSSLILDDLSPLYRAQLIAQVGSNDMFALDDPFEEEVKRTNFANIFERTYLHRRMECLGCHNSEMSVTGSPDPESDHTWEVPGHFEKALYGDSTGRSRADLLLFFRVRDVVKTQVSFTDGQGLFYEYVEGFAPWGVVMECGRFVAPGDVGDDWLEQSGYFVDDYGSQASIWDLETLLASGFARLREQGFTVPGPNESLAVDGDVALAKLTAMSIAGQIWEEAFGSRLTIPNYFPRNREQRDTLIDLSKRFVAGGYSLRELLVAVTTHPYFNQKRPSQCADIDGAYYMAAIFDPMSVDSEIENERRNSVGDQVHRYSARVLVDSVSYAMHWTPNTEFFGDLVNPDREEQVMASLPVLSLEAQFQRDIGMFLKDTEIGFRGMDFQTALTWETTYSPCRDPNLVEVTQEPGGPPVDSTESCAGRCGKDSEESNCACDPSCMHIGDCCPDFESVCAAMAFGFGSPDWIERILTLGETIPEATFGDAVSALKDRLLTDPDLSDPSEQQRLADLADVALDTPLASLEDADQRLRWICGAYLNVPQFLLAGLASPAGANRQARIRVPETAFKSLCEAHAAELFASGVMSCSENAVTLKQ